MRLPHGIKADQTVEYAELDQGTIDYILRLPDGEDQLVLPFALEYAPHGRDAESALEAFDPTTGKHLADDGSPIEIHYRAPYRFLITDRDIQGSLMESYEAYSLCRLPFWLYLLLA